MTDHQEKEDLIGRIGRTDGLFVLSEQIKMFICPCPNLLGLLFFKKKQDAALIVSDNTDKLIR